MVPPVQVGVGLPTTTDPAKWIPDLLETRWGLAVESLRAQGVGITMSFTPSFRPTGRRDATESIRHSVSVKVYQTMDEEYTRVTHGDLDEDVVAGWAVQFAAGGEYEKARRLVHEAALIAHRLLLLYRNDPHVDWQHLEDIRVVHDVDYPEYQRRTVQFRLMRFGEPTPTGVNQVTTP